ncbi:MAG: hypothetical protein HYX71_10765 [Opitutae bacterium]|nr:hypothetical protein [Opitutae bacterium]
MKPARSTLLILGGLLALAAVAGGLALTPAVQRRAVLRTLRSVRGLKCEVTTVSAGFSRIELGGVRLEEGGVRMQLEQLEADWSPWRLLFGRRLVLGRLSSRGLFIDASKVSAARANAAAAGAPAATPGLLTQIELPFALELADCLIEGRALLPGNTGRPPVEAAFKITGGGFAPGQEGALTVTAMLKNPAPAARVAVLNAEVKLRARQTLERTFSRVALAAVVDAEGRKLSAQEQLRIAATLAKSAAGENYEFTVDTVLDGKPDKVIAVDATLPAGGKEFAGRWRLSARTAQVEPFMLGAGLPEFNARGEGRFTFAPGSGAASLQGDLAAEVSRLEAWEPAWRAFGAVKLTARFDLAATEGLARLNQLHVAVAGDQPVLELSAAHAAEINFRERRLLLGSAAAGEALTLNLQGLPVAWVRPFVRGLDFSGGLITGQLAVTGEADRLLLRTVQPLQVGRLSVVQAGQLLLNKADATADFDAVLTKQELQATVSAFTLKTPAGDSVTAQAKVTMPVGPDPAVTIVANYKADLPALLAPFLTIGPIQSTGEADFTLAGRKIELRRLQAAVTGPDGQEMFKATALRPFTFDLATGQAAIVGTPDSKTVLRLDFARLSLAAVPLPLPGIKLGGFVADGELVVEVDGDKVRLRAPRPFVLKDVTVKQNGRSLLAGLNVDAQPLLELTGGTQVRFETGDITIHNQRGRALAKLAAAGSQSAANGAKGSLNFSLEVPALAEQPLFAGARAVSAGRAGGEVRFALGAVRQAEARLTVNGLVAAATNEILPVANLSLRAVAPADGKISVQAPLLLDRAGYRSDLALAVDLAPAGRGYHLDGRLTGEQVELNDAVAVLGVFMMSAADEPTAIATVEPAPVVADKSSAWARLTGRLALDVKSVVRGADWAMTGLTGAVVIEPADVALQKLEAAFGEKGRFAAKGLLSFTKGPRPYDFTGDFSLTEFDAGKLFKALDPSRPATVEGVFSVAGSFSGNGENPGRAFERSHGAFTLISRQGVFRGLQRTTGKVSLATKAVDLVGSLFGNSKVVEKVAGAAYHVDQLAQTLGELNYDQLNMKLVRDPQLNFTLEDISLVSPEIRLLGKGAVTHVAGKPLLEQPLNASLTLAGRGKIEEQLGRLRLLSGARDELDYAKAKETITLGGTLARPDPAAFFTRLATGKLTDLLAPDK